MLSSRIVRKLPARCLTPRTLRLLQPRTTPNSYYIFPAQHHQVRHKFDLPLQDELFRAKVKTAYRENPVSFTAALIVAIMGVGSLGYTIYYAHLSERELLSSRYPEEVAKPLRKAIYYTNIKWNPALANKYYNQAISKINELRLNPFTEEIIGLRIHIAAFLVRAEYPEAAIDDLERMVDRFRWWLKERGNDPNSISERRMILWKLVQVNAKLADYYALDSILNPEKAEEKMIYAIELALQEKDRREKEGVKEGEGPWLSDEEFGAQFEALAHFYEAKDDHYLAAPLFLRALTLADPKSCHITVLMNNLSISLAQQNPRSIPGQSDVSRREALLSNARAWSKKALEIAANIKPPERTDECDVGCAVATHNLGEFAEMDGDIAEARKRYEEAKSLANAIGFKEGVVNAEKGIKRVTQT